MISSQQKIWLKKSVQNRIKYGALTWKWETTKFRKALTSFMHEVKRNIKPSRVADTTQPHLLRDSEPIPQDYSSQVVPSILRNMV